MAKAAANKADTPADIPAELTQSPVTEAERRKGRTIKPSPKAPKQDSLQECIERQRKVDAKREEEMQSLVDAVNGALEEVDPMMRDAVLARCSQKA